jgi:hypothetical protein
MVKRNARRGASTGGCLVSILVLMVVLYYGINLGRVWWRYFEIQDRMKMAARYSQNQSDAQIQAQLKADALDIGLPGDAARFRLTRVAHPPSITITTEYHEDIDLPLLKKTLTFRPKVYQSFAN